MVSAFPMSDYDFSISRILLVHKNRFVPRFRWNEYRSGRCFDGFSFCVSGQGSFQFKDQCYVLNPGEAVFLPAGSTYVVSCGGGEPFVHYTVNFNLRREEPGTVAVEPSVVSEILEGRLVYRTQAEDSHVFLPLLEQLLSAWQDKKNGFNVLSKSILYEILYRYFSDAGRRHRRVNDYDRISAAVEILEDCCSRETISELAELCHMSDVGFRRAFERVFGCSPVEYRTEKRILFAKDLLLSGEYNISQAAQAAGYPDANYFSRVFRKCTGMTPKQYLTEN